MGIYHQIQKFPFRGGIILPMFVILSGPGFAVSQLIWSKATVYTWATSLQCSPAQSTNLVSTTSIAVGALDVYGFDTSNGAQVKYFAANGKANQQWDVTKQTDGSYKFVNVATGKCMDGYGQGDGQTLRQYDCSSGTPANQKVYLEKVTTVRNCNTQWSTYRLRFASASAASCLTQQTDGNTVFKPCLPNKSDSSQNFFLQDGSAIIPQSWSKGTVYTWATSLQCSPAQSTNLVSTTSIAVGALDVIGFDTTNGAQVKYYAANGKPNQLWDITMQADGSYKFVNVATGKCLDGYGQGTGQTLRQYDCSSGTLINQKVYLEKVSSVPNCNTQWSTYRLRFASASAANCLTQQTDGNTVFKACLPNKSDSSQNFFLQDGSSAPTSSPSPPRRPPPPPPPPPRPPPPGTAPPPAAAQYNVNSKHPFPLQGTGLGANVWQGDMSVEILYSQLKMSFIRLWFDYYPNNWVFCNSGTTLQRLQDLWKGFDNWGMVPSGKLAAKYGVQIMALNKKPPDNWINIYTDGSLKAECEQYYGLWWTAAVQRLRGDGIDVQSIEIVNEPDFYGGLKSDGTAGTVYISPQSYARVVNHIYNAFQQNGLGFVKIVGPGRSGLAAPDPYVAACGGCLLSTWSTHPYEWDDAYLSTSAGFRQGFTSLVNQAWSLKSNIPFIASEFGTMQRKFHGKPWTDYPHTLDTYSDTKPYWARTIANMINAFNAGASSVLFWEAADQPWATRDNSWGIIRASDGYKKPGYYALLSIFPVIPAGASILKSATVDPQLATAVFVKDKTLVILIANDLDVDKTATVSVANVRVASATPVTFNTWTYAGQDNAIKSTLTVNTSNGLWVSVKTFVDSVVTLKFNLL